VLEIDSVNESEIIERLRLIATAPEARRLLDDVAVLDGLVISHDSIAEGVHFLPNDPPASVGWKLAAVNLSDLAGKGAQPAAAILSLTIAGESDWEDAFLTGVEAACETYALPLIGGDTIALPPGAPRVLGMTVIGRAGPFIPERSGGKAGDSLWVVGTVGDAAAGLRALIKDRNATGPLVEIYRRPIPQLSAGQAMAPSAHAMMDVSDGLLLDARRLAQASGLEASIDLDRIPLSKALIAELGDSSNTRLLAATGGDDYALLAALPPDLDPSTLSLPHGTRITRVGSLSGGEAGISLTRGGKQVELPESLGFEHQGHERRRPAGPPMADRP
jgi:thiamine-monophosphate kinase